MHLDFYPARRIKPTRVTVSFRLMRAGTDDGKSESQSQSEIEPSLVQLRAVFA